MGITVVTYSFVMKSKGDNVYKVIIRVLDTQYLASVDSYYY